ncbi:MAG: heme lyase CcmF/NrfE family subunit [Flavimaricola sp.]|nr:heme lyase CcmF/NrfE family subunit [Flavimaricola sp.]
MEAELGTFTISLSLIIALASGFCGLAGAHYRHLPFMTVASAGMLMQGLLIIVAFACLTVAFVQSDFSVLLVATNSNTSMPLLYRITGVWGNHEGSLLLWILILVLFGSSIALGGNSLPPTLKARVLGIQSLISASFLGLMLFTSNPFARLWPAAVEGQELNPLLQDIGLAIHPPFLYLGYVGFSVVFAFAVAALIEGRVEASWARFVRPWILAAWCFLTIGITLGSYWAYYELGWGGWWFWDPVENASFMPWLVGTALLHSALVVERRGALVVWTLLLAILTFSLSLVGTFLVRSGLLTSVHSFAADPSRGIGVLMILVAATGGALTLFSIRAKQFTHPVLFAPVSREGGLILNNILLLTATGTVFLGTFYPLFIELMGDDRISVGPPYFNRSFIPIMIPLMLVVVVGTNLRWKRDSIGAAIKRGLWAIVPVALVLGVTVAFGGLGHLGAAFGLGLAAWLVFGSIAYWVSRVNLFRVPLARSIAMAFSMPRAVYGMILAHAGLGLAVAGMVAVTSWQEEQIVALALGEHISLSGYELRLDRVQVYQGPNFEAERGTFVVIKDGRTVAEMTPERRFFTGSGRLTTEAAIQYRGLSNLYLAMGDPGVGGTWTVRGYWHPFVLLIWIGPLVMSLGGFVSLSDRRFRLGTPAQRPVTALVAGT